MSTSGHWIQSVVNWLGQATADAAMDSEIREALAKEGTLELDSLLSVLDSSPELLSVSAVKTRLLFQLVAARSLELAEDPEAATLNAENLHRLYELLSGIDGAAAAHTLQVLAGQGDDESLESLIELLVESPPARWQEVGVGLSPLWHAEADELQSFFAQVSEAILHPSTMTVLLDLANYSVRQQKVADHPWRERVAQLTGLLNEVVKQLKKLEEDPSQFGDSVETVQETLGESLALTISLCDALGLIGSKDCVDSLSSAMALSHRRVQTEAAGALAVLGEAEGKERLLELAEDRAARLRAVAYADELGFAEELSAEVRAPQALAESELAGWLAAPEQYGLAPNSMEMVDTRSMYWPSYEEPQNCFLFRYNYSFPQGSVSNVGIAGPLNHAFAADLGNLPVEDIYAAFAGWQAEHEEIYEIAAETLNTAQQREAQKLSETLRLQELEVTRTIALTFFFGEIALLAEVQQEDKELCAVTDGQETLCFPTGGRANALTPDVVLCIYRGRKLLRTFNP